MKTIIIIIYLFFGIFNTFQNSQSLTGKWTLICYKDISSGERTNRPSNYSAKKLTFEFLDNGKEGTFKGRTTVNDVTGEYKINKMRISVDRFGGTKIAEHGWGSVFWSTISNSSSFEFRQDTLIILYDNDSKEMLFLPYNEDNIKN